MKQLKLAFIGGGNMARSLISGLIKHGYEKEKISVSNRSKEKLIALEQDFSIKTSQDNYDVAKDADIIILAVKPQFMSDMLTELSSKITNYSNKLIISLAAGMTIERLSKLMNNHKKIIRVMPNTPALIGFGITGMYAEQTVSQEEKNYASSILSAVGKAVWVDKESDINIVTAASGSGPAYFFLFMEYMIRTTKELGLSEEVSRELVQQTALGASQMVIQNNTTSLETLRAQVTSKGGTTHAAITTFEQNELEKIVKKSMNAAMNRAEEMQKLF